MNRNWTVKELLSGFTVVAKEIRTLPYSSTHEVVRIIRNRISTGKSVTECSKQVFGYMGDSSWRTFVLKCES